MTREGCRRRGPRGHDRDLVAEMGESDHRGGLLGRRHVDLALGRVLGGGLAAEDRAAGVDGGIRVQPEERVIERTQGGELDVDEKH